MTSERLQQIEELYHFALEKDPADRLAFLNESCNGDEELRQEVESLLASQAEAGDFIEEPVHEVAARLIADNQKRSMVGRVIGHYEIIELLGAGGMGEVYLARDTTLVRKVALKLLPDYFTCLGQPHVLPPSSLFTPLFPLFPPYVSFRPVSFSS